MSTKSFWKPEKGNENFLQEERKYVSEAKWDRFPEGSRLLIGRSLPEPTATPSGPQLTRCTGNLSSERVSKREVFDIFSKCGRLAQISLKTAYGFVQYYTVAEGQAAMDTMQGIEIKGRKIRKFTSTCTLLMMNLSTSRSRDLKDPEEGWRRRHRETTWPKRTSGSKPKRT